MTRAAARTQLDLFGPPRRVPAPRGPSAPFQVHSATSHAAADAVAPTAGSKRAQVHKYLLERDATDEELQAALGMGESTERPRRIELVGQGLVRDTGQTRLTSRGKQASVWTTKGCRR